MRWAWPAVALAACAARAQTTWHVDDDAPGDPAPGDASISDPLEDGSAEHPFDEIQEGVDAAADGDTVRILRGFYAQLVRIDGKSIALQGEDRNDVVIGPVGVAAAMVTISGTSDDQVAIHDLSLQNSDDRDFYGHGIESFGANVYIARCTIDGTRGDRGRGSALNLDGPSRATYVRVEDSTLSDAYVYPHGLGGGVLVRGRIAVDLVRCEILRNSAEYGAGMMVRGGAKVALYHCVLHRNFGVFGVAFWIDGGEDGQRPTELSLVSCLISGEGGDGHDLIDGFYAGPSTRITVSGSSVVTANYLTFTTLQHGSLHVENSVLWALSEIPGDVFVVDLLSDAAMQVRSSVVVGGPPRIRLADGAALDWDTTSISDDPMMRDPDGPDDDINTRGNNDFRLAAGSPCIDAGDNSLVPADAFDLDGDGDTNEPIPIDFDARPRFVDDPFTLDPGIGAPPIVDMGAYEYDCTGDQNGDGRVDMVDLANLLSHFGIGSGMSYTEGDLDGDSDVDLADLSRLLSVFGQECA